MLPLARLGGAYLFGNLFFGRILVVDALLDLIDHVRKRAILAMAYLQITDGFDLIDGVFGTDRNVCALQHFQIVVEISDAPKLRAGIDRFQIGKLRFFGNALRQDLQNGFARQHDIVKRAVFCAQFFLE